ncbi:hypothetical protein AVEN_244804-1, partial [Araneus ventricosus]
AGSAGDAGQEDASDPAAEVGAAAPGPLHRQVGDGEAQPLGAEEEVQIRPLEVAFLRGALLRLTAENRSNRSNRRDPRFLLHFVVHRRIPGHRPRPHSPATERGGAEADLRYQYCVTHE